MMFYVLLHGWEGIRFKVGWDILWINLGFVTVCFTAHDLELTITAMNRRIRDQDAMLKADLGRTLERTLGKALAEGKVVLPEHGEIEVNEGDDTIKIRRVSDEEVEQMKKDGLLKVD